MAAGWLWGVIDGRPAQGRWRSRPSPPPTPLVRQPIDRSPCGALGPPRRPPNQRAPSKMPARPFRMPWCVGPLQRPCRCCCPPRRGKTRPSLPPMDASLFQEEAARVVARLACADIAFDPVRWGGWVCQRGGESNHGSRVARERGDMHDRGMIADENGLAPHTKKGEDVDCARYRGTAGARRLISRGGRVALASSPKMREPKFARPRLGRAGRRGNAKGQGGVCGVCPVPTRRVVGLGKRCQGAGSRSRRVRTVGSGFECDEAFEPPKKQAAEALTRLPPPQKIEIDPFGMGRGRTQPCTPVKASKAKPSVCGLALTRAPAAALSVATGNVIQT